VQPAANSKRNGITYGKFILLNSFEEAADLTQQANQPIILQIILSVSVFVP